MKKIFTLIAIAMMAVGAQAQQTLFHWQPEAVPAIDASNAATGGTIVAKTTDTSKSFSNEGAKYVTSVTDDMKSLIPSNKAIKFGSSSLYFVVTLTSGKFKTGDVIMICGYNKFKISSASKGSGDIASSLATGSTKDNYDIGSVKIPAGIETNTLYIERAEGSSTGIAAIKVTRSNEPYLDVTKTSLSFHASPLKNSITEEFQLAGERLTDGTYNLTVPSVTGLTVSPTSFTVTDGVVNQKISVTYTSTEDVAKNTANIVATVGSYSATVSVSYQSRAALIEQTTVSQETTWDWTKLTETVQLTAETTPKNTDSFVLANLDYLIDFGTFKASDIVISNAVYPSRAGKFQDGTIGFKTSTTGTIVVDFSDTGSSGTGVDRFLYVNGTKTNYSTKRDGTADRRTTDEIEIAAGNVTINAMTEDTENPGQMKAAAICVYSIKFTPKDVTDPIPAATGIKGVEAAATAAPAVKKYLENGQIVIEKAGKKFTAAGAQLK